MKKAIGLQTVILLLCVSFGYAQKSDSCLVLMKEISGSYNGVCIRGLANGRGVAKGEGDAYSGDFINGLPDGKGTYVYENGNKFTGLWSKGVKSGQGKFVYYLNGVEQVQKGFWVNGDYVGPSESEFKKRNSTEPYRIISQLGIGSCSIQKREDSRDMKVSITIYGAMIRYIPQDLQITHTNGQLLQEAKSFSVYKYTCPLNCSVNYTIMIGGISKVCSLSFDILKPGNYDVFITNN